VPAGIGWPARRGWLIRGVISRLRRSASSARGVATIGPELARPELAGGELVE